MPHRDNVRDRLDEYLATRDLAAVWFAEPTSFAWVTGGDNVVDRTAQAGIAAVGYDGDGFTVVTNNIEAPRLAAEELPDDVTVEATDWFDADLPSAIADASPTPAAADVDVPGFETLDPTDLRQPMTDDDVERYRALGSDTAAVVERVCREATPDDTERTVASRLRAALFERGIESPVVLVGGSTRAQQYRHYTAKDDRLGEYALVSVSASRGGLHASCTRTVAFDPPDWLRERTTAAMRVEATALAATRQVGRDGGTAGDVFAAIQDAYAAVGHEGEWEHHHQGGAAGYAGREWIATPDATRPVHLSMAYAWNPTVQGTKSEDTYLVTADGVENLTATGDWPTRTVEPVDTDHTGGTDAVVERHVPLEP